MRLAIKRVDESVANFRDTDILPRVGDSIGWSSTPGIKLTTVTTVILWPDQNILSFHDVSTDYKIDALVLTA